MNSDKAAAVRDSINGCPDVVSDEQIVERTDRDSYEKRNGDTITGDRLQPNPSQFKPAYIKQSGKLGDGDGRTTPVYVVVLESVWLETTDVRSLSSEMVYEIAKHDCTIRFYPPGHRLGGAIWIVDHFTEDLTNTDGDRCPECDGTYFKLRDGEPECARCGHTEEPTVQKKITAK